MIFLRFGYCYSHDRDDTPWPVNHTSGELQPWAKKTFALRIGATSIGYYNYPNQIIFIISKIVNNHFSYQTNSTI